MKSSDQHKHKQKCSSNLHWISLIVKREMVTVTHHQNQIGTGLKKNDSNTISNTLHVSGMDFNKSNQIYSHVSHRQLNENSTKHSFLYIVHVCVCACVRWMQPPKIPFKKSQFSKHIHSNFHGLMILLHICHYYTFV